MYKAREDQKQKPRIIDIYEKVILAWPAKEII